jgi:hypothetical protein
MLRPLRILLAALACLLVTAGTARAAGGSYVFDGGTPSQRAQVHAALEASAFDWSLVPGTVTIHIARAIESEALPGEIWLDADLLDSGRFAWGVVQHEYAHQVDFLLLTSAARAELAAALGGSDWCDSARHDIAHSAHGCERFASTLAWAYWPARDNCMRPESRTDEAAAMAPAAFRKLLARLIAAPDRVSQLRRRY